MNYRKKGITAGEDSLWWDNPDNADAVACCGGALTLLHAGRGRDSPHGCQAGAMCSQPPHGATARAVQGSGSVTQVCGTVCPPQCGQLTKRLPRQLGHSSLCDHLPSQPTTPAPRHSEHLRPVDSVDPALGELGPGLRCPEAWGRTGLAAGTLRTSCRGAAPEMWRLAGWVRASSAPLDAKAVAGLAVAAGVPHARPDGRHHARDQREKHDELQAAHVVSLP
jgi:hypothetical protein